MAPRVRRPTDEPTEVRDPRIARGQAPQPGERIGVRAGEPAGRAIEHATPTQLDPPPGPGEDVTAPGPPGSLGLPGSPGSPASLGSPGSSVARVRDDAAHREPLHVISMKDRVDAARPRADDRRAPLHVQLRSLAEVARRNDTPTSLGQLGRLAPPRDPHQVRARHWRANVMWGCVAIALACGISLVVWFAAGR